MEEYRGAELQRGLGRVEAALAAQATWQQGHDAGDQREFAEIRGNFASQDVRLSAIERLCDTVEGHGEALVSLEGRMSESEDADRLRRNTKSRDGLWLKWILFIVTSIAADRFMPKLLGLLGSFKP